MQDAVGLFFLGTAGCGKSTLAAALAGWLDERGYPFQLINLDPGADLIPYEPDIDVRDWITLADVMEEYGLGPNGAQIVAADMLALHSSKIRSLLDMSEGRYLLFDTPGQMELFTFRESSRHIVGELCDRSFLVYIVDPFNSKTPSGFISQLVFSSLARMRFLSPSLEVLSKSDMIDEETMEKIRRWQISNENLDMDMLEETRRNPSMSNELSMSICRALEDLGIISGVFPISSATGEGLQRIYEVVQLTYGGGEDISSPR